MAMNLLKHDFAVVVYDADPAKLAPFIEQGAVSARSPAEVAASVERTVSMVATTAQAEAVIAGDDGIMQGAQAGHIVLSMSTIDPFAAQRLHDHLATKGIKMLDAPVSGGTVRSASGELSIMVGGDRAVFDACQDMFNAMGTNIFHIGPIGQGLAMKLVNNMLVQTHLVAICEALVMGVKAGLDPQTIYDVVRVSTGTSYGFETRVPRILDGDFVAGGSVDISYKDQELETAFAKQLGVPIFMANVSQQVFQMARASGLGHADHGAIIKVLEQFAGVKVRRQ
jgi:3-hydroxyisobutyrate dehydrogenase-like beta-hydroxyacid dehydrogenase